MSPDGQPHYFKGHPHHLGSSSNVAQFGQVQFQFAPNSTTTNIQLYGPPPQHVFPISLTASSINLHNFCTVGKYFFSRSIANVWYFNIDTTLHISSNSYHALLLTHNAFNGVWDSIWRQWRRKQWWWKSTSA